MFRPQYDKEGLIVDERFNNGGQIPDRFVELLDRPLYNLLGGAVGQGLADAGDRPDGAEGDAHQRVERFGRGCVSLLLPCRGSRDRSSVPAPGVV